MMPVSYLPGCRSEMKLLVAENQRLRIQAAELRGANIALHDIINDLRKRLAEVYAQKLRLMAGDDNA